MKIEYYIAELLDNILTAVVIAIIYYAFSNNINNTYYVALILAIIGVLWTTGKNLFILKFSADVENIDNHDNNDV